MPKRERESKCSSVVLLVLFFEVKVLSFLHNRLDDLAMSVRAKVELYERRNSQTDELGFTAVMKDNKDTNKVGSMHLF